MIAARRASFAAAAIVGVSLFRAQAQTPDRRLERPADGGSGRRLALIVGNDTYATAPLKNARNDARAVSAALRDVGFTTTVVLDAKRADLGAALSTFARDLGDRDTALFYYAGHGVQVDGDNFLIPVDYSGQTEDAARWDTVPVGRVHDVLRKARVSLIVLDACRNNPFAGARSAGGGLAAMEARGSLVAFAAGAGQTASDNGATGNGLFTTHLLTTLQTPGLGVREVFRRTRELVVQATGGKQFPAVYDGLVGDFVFRPISADPPAATSVSKPATEDLTRQEDLLYWSSIKDSNDPALFDEYLKRFGDSARFLAVARSRIADLRPSRVTAASGAVALNSPPVARVAPTLGGPRFQAEEVWPRIWPSGLPGQSWPVTGLAVGPSDHVWLAKRDPYNQSGAMIFHFDGDGGFVRAWGGPRIDVQTSIRALAIDRRGRVWVGDGSGGQILLFTAEGKFLMQVGAAVAHPDSNDVRGFNGVSKIALDESTNEAYIADGYGNHRVAVIDSDTGRFKRYWGAYGNKPSDADLGRYNPAGPLVQQFRDVYCAEISNDGFVYVCDRQNNRIQVFTKNGKFVKEASLARNTLGGGTVWDLCFSRDAQQRHLYVADGTNQLVHILERTSLTELASLGGVGSAPGQFAGPLHNIAIDSHGNIYTAEGDSARVQRFAPARP